MRGESALHDWRYKANCSEKRDMFFQCPSDASSDKSISNSPRSRDTRKEKITDENPPGWQVILIIWLLNSKCPPTESKSASLWTEPSIHASFHLQYSPRRPQSPTESWRRHCYPVPISSLWWAGDEGPRGLWPRPQIRLENRWYELAHSTASIKQVDNIEDKVRELEKHDKLCFLSGSEIRKYYQGPYLKIKLSWTHFEILFSEFLFSCVSCVPLGLGSHHLLQPGWQVLSLRS